jgi:hypothetical protein
MSCELPPPKKQKRRANLLYKLRRKGVRCDILQRTIYYPYGANPEDVIQIRRLREEYHFNVQFEIV